MNELKVYVNPLKTNMFGETIVGQSYYLKSEADKVIAHHKYKRCLMMYRYCSIRALYELDFKGNDVKWKWYSKWMHKWFKFAEKFKEAK